MEKNNVSLTGQVYEMACNSQRQMGLLNECSTRLMYTSRKQLWQKNKHAYNSSTTCTI